MAYENILAGGFGTGILKVINYSPPHILKQRQFNLRTGLLLLNGNAFPLPINRIKPQIQNIADSESIAQTLGHTSTESTEAYISLSMDTLRICALEVDF